MKKIIIFFYFFFLTFNVFSQETTITSFILVNADTDKDITEITEDKAINLLDYPNTSFSIRANTSGPVKSVHLRLFGTVSGSVTENVAPYALFGDILGDYNGKSLTPGDYMVEATSYDALNLGGNPSVPHQINFNVINVELPRPFVTTWKTDNPGYSEDNQITIPTFEGANYNYSVNWGDGSFDDGVTSEITHTFDGPGTYQVSISGDFPRIYFNNDGDKDKLIDVNQWGQIEWMSMESAFWGCHNLKVTAEDSPNFLNLSSLRLMFKDCESLIGSNIGSWDVSNVENFSNLFDNAKIFNQDLNDWDVSKALSMNAMFDTAILFNGNISNWDVSNTVVMSYMFRQAYSFNQNIENWNVGNVVYFTDMFNSASNFNHNISAWDVSNAIYMSGMFASNPLFNQDISEWNVSNVKFMSAMFFQTTSFNQNLASWNISNVLLMDEMFGGTSLSTQNYDNTLLGWSTQQLQVDVNFNAGMSEFCQGEEARKKLIDDFEWNIIDGGKSDICRFCPTELIVLNTQQDVDDFINTYDVANCTFANGILIEGTDINNLGGLSSLTNIDGFLKIVNTSLINIDELSALTSVRLLVLIKGNSLLTDIGALSSLTTSSFINISDNALLNNVDGLASITHIYSDLIIQNNASLTNLDGLSSLVSISDSFIIKNNASLTNLDGLASLSFLDNDLSIESNPVLTSLDGLLNLDAIGLSLKIQSNSALINLDGLSSITNIYVDLIIANNDNLVNLDGLSNINRIGGELNIIGNDTLSDCTINAVCDSETIVGGTVTISDNNGNCSNISAAMTACIEEEEALVDLIAATYLEGSRNPDPTGPLLRAEYGNREIYLQFDMGSFNSEITSAQLEMQVASDPGNGTLEVFLGSFSNWTENGLSGSNKPESIGSALASISGTHSLGQTKTWDLDVSNLDGEGLVTLIIKHSNGNDVAFASDETNIAPKLLIKSRKVPVVKRAFVTTWETDNKGISDDNQIYISTSPDEIYNFTIDWGDGTFDTEVEGDIIHNYETPGIYQISISGDFPQMYFKAENFLSDSKKIINVNQWGDISWKSMERAFRGCSNLVVFANDAPDLSKVTSLEHMFADATSLSGNFNNWDTTTITNMGSMFYNASYFNSDISDWNTSAVQSMRDMFSNTILFNQDLGEWDTSSVTNMHAMFADASSFNMDISGWNTSSVTWMGYMFKGASSFNQDLSNWNTSLVNYVGFMFKGASSFNNNIGNWSVSKVTDMTEIFDDSGLSDSNYDNILLGWGTQTVINGVVFDANKNQYCSSELVRQNLIDDFGWIISDGGKSDECTEEKVTFDVIDGTYLEGDKNPKANGPLLRAEEGNREIYLKFDLSSFNETINQAQLQMQVSSDPGNGFLEVFKGSSSNWNESSLTGTNKPIAVGNAISSISGEHLVGNTKIWDLDISDISSGDFITLIVRHRNGNDVAFASDETNEAPVLIVHSAGSEFSLSENLFNLSPNPASDRIALEFETSIVLNMIFIYDLTGKLILSETAGDIQADGKYYLDVSDLPNGMYFVRTVDSIGISQQNSMLIEH